MQDVYITYGLYEGYDRQGLPASRPLAASMCSARGTNALGFCAFGVRALDHPLSAPLLGRDGFLREREYPGPTLESSQNAVMRRR